MIHEMTLVRKLNELFGVPVRTAYDVAISQDEINLRQRLIREETDELIHKGLEALNVVQVADGVCDSMVVTAGTLVQLGLDPGIADFGTAAKELLEDARMIVFNGLKLRQMSDVKIGCCAIEIVCKGIAGCLNLPYQELFQEVHNNNMSKVDKVTGKPIFDAGGKFLKPEGWKPPRIEEILKAHGLYNKPENES